MSKYNLVWEYVKKENSEELKLTFEEVKKILGFEIDHSFLTFKKELKSYKDVNYAVEELQILSQSINKQTHAGKVVSLLGSIEIVNKKTKKSVTDFDGLAFLINKTNMSILISESKFHKKSSQTKASNQLEKRMKELGISVEINKLDNGAWCIVDSGVLDG